MPAVFVHGVPDTDRMWDALRSHLHRADVVAVSLPGFGAPLPPGFDPVKESYVDWLIGEIARLGEPVDLVGHDWGSLLVQRAVSLRPDLVRTWACGDGPIDVDYVWHDTAQQWQTPEVGEQMMAMVTPEMLEEGLVVNGVPRAYAKEAVAHVDETMQRCILRLYRSAVHVGREWQPDVEKISKPALILWSKDDPFVTPVFAQRLAERVRGQLILFEGCGHWWPLERPAEAAAALERFWASV